MTTATIRDADLTRDEIIARNLEVVEAHFHNENPEDVDKAIALYAPTISWEGPNRGVHYTDPAEVKESYLGIFRTLAITSMTTLRRFATEEFVFDDAIAEAIVIGNEMPNMNFPVGSQLRMRLVHCFELKDGKITKEIAYEMFREKGGPLDLDAIPDGAIVEVFDNTDEN